MIMWSFAKHRFPGLGLGPRIWKKAEHIKNGVCMCVYHGAQSLADEFYQTYNDQAFNSIEPEICHLVYVASVESVLSSDVSCLYYFNCQSCFYGQAKLAGGVMFSTSPVWNLFCRPMWVVSITLIVNHVSMARLNCLSICLFACLSILGRK